MSAEAEKMILKPEHCTPTGFTWSRTVTGGSCHNYDICHNKVCILRSQFVYKRDLKKKKKISHCDTVICTFLFFFFFLFRIRMKYTNGFNK